MKDNTYCLLVAEIALAIVATVGLIIENETVTIAAVTGLLGVLGGHMNGAQGAPPAVV